MDLILLNVLFVACSEQIVEEQGEEVGVIPGCCTGARSQGPIRQVRGPHVRKVQNAFKVHKSREKPFGAVLVCDHVLSKVKKAL